jgi:NAD(P)-dependent dehydrogenase (short-subunit alcohol dehydrogenase family)
MIDHAVDHFGRLDCLVNNAGRGSQFATIADVDLEQFDAVIAVHLRAVLAGMKMRRGLWRCRDGQHHQRRECQRNTGKYTGMQADEADHNPEYADFVTMPAQATRSAAAHDPSGRSSSIDQL